MGGDRSEINTGIRELDNDLEALFKLDESDMLIRISELNKDTDAPIGEILDVVPAGAFRVAVTLLDEEKFKNLRGGLRRDAIDTIERAKQFAADVLKPVLEMKAVQKLIEEGELRTQAGKRFASRAMTAPRILVYSAWELIGRSNLFLPGIRFFFGDRSGDRLLMDCNLSWEETGEFSRKFLSTLCEDMEDAVKVDVKLDPDIFNENFPAIEKKIIEMEENIKKIKGFMETMKKRNDKEDQENVSGKEE